MKMTLARAFCASLSLTPIISASPVVDLDFIVLQHGGATVFGDEFDNSALEGPPWYVVTGSPGPESDSALTLRAGDMIAATIAPLDPGMPTSIVAGMNLVNFSGDDSASLILLGDEPGESYTLSIVPLAAYFIDNTASAIGIGPALTFGDMHFEVMFDSTGAMKAEVNGITVFDNELDFGPLTGIAFGVVPEPSTLVLLGLGLVAMIRRYRYERHRATSGF